MKPLPISLLFYASLFSPLPAYADPPRLIADYPHEAPIELGRPARRLAEFCALRPRRGHSVAYETRELIYGWLDSHLKPAEATQTRLVGEAPGPPPR